MACFVSLVFTVFGWYVFGVQSYLLTFGVSKSLGLWTAKDKRFMWLSGFQEIEVQVALESWFAIGRLWYVGYEIPDLVTTQQKV